MEATRKYRMDMATRNMGKPIANIHRKTIRSRILDAIFGKQNRVLIIVPDGCVDRITFTEDSNREDSNREDRDGIDTGGETDG